MDEKPKRGRKPLPPGTRRVQMSVTLPPDVVAVLVEGVETRKWKDKSAGIAALVRAGAEFLGKK